MGASQLPHTVIAPDSPAPCLEEMANEKMYVEEVIYQDQIPDFVAATLIRLYDNVFCTLHRIEAYDSLQGISTYIKRIDSVIQTVILFRIRGKTISVVNQQISLTKEEVDQFAKKIFADYKRAQIISFYAINIIPDQLNFPSQHVAALEENIVHFPSSVEDYLKRLKGQFRKQLRVFKEQLLADHPGYEIKLVSREEIEAEHIRAVLDLAKARMRLRGKDDYTRHVNVPVLTTMLRKCGHMAIAVIDNKICGGAMWLSVGRRHFHQLAAHDPTYDRYMLGNQLWFAAISYSLILGGSECWLMGGSSEHKARFGAQKKVFNSYILYRSCSAVFLNLPKYVSMWAKYQQHKTRLAIKDISTKNSPLGRCVNKGARMFSQIRASMHHFS